MLSRPLVLATALAALAPASASALTVAPTRPSDPGTAAFPDRISQAPASRHLRAKAAQAANTIQVPTREGYSVSVSFTPAFGVQPDVAQTYVTFLDSLPHGTELSRLNVLIALPGEVGTLCGGGGDVLACYGGGQMIVPGQEISNGGPVTSFYAVAHEYGHHIAANRRNPPFNAIDFGPKYWASYERVCARTLDGQLAPGDEGANYTANPGESWADTYAHLVYPDVPWQFTPLLAPDAGALDIARRDVLAPWTKRVTRSFTMRASRRTQAFRIPLRLDGSLTVRATGRRGTKVAASITAGSRRVASSRGRGRSARISLPYACRTEPVETLSFRVARRAGRGPVGLRVTYPG
jgi:hypothetical protein